MENYQKLEKKLKIEFKNKGLLKNVFVHKSYTNEHKGEKIDDNERLEFLGDAVLELCSTKYLFDNNPEATEGEMTLVRSALVKGKHLAEVAKDLELGKYLFLSKGEEKSGGREKNYILANTLEALIGAMYIEHGYAKVESFIKRVILSKLDQIVTQGLHIDAKSRFQELCQEKEEFTPYYELLEASGPDHDKTFVMGVYIDDKMVAKGTGSSKQKAEEDAAENALKIKKW
ncbi:MAG: ribonuclease III [Candidatus Gracilibacteria bacterium]|jgi:ribonuclease-3